MSTQPRFVAIVLSAGQGTRMKSALPKVLHPRLGRPMISYPMKATLDAGAERVVVVLGHGRQQVEAELSARYDTRVTSSGWPRAYASVWRLRRPRQKRVRPRWERSEGEAVKEKPMHKQSFAKVTMLAACCASALGLSSCQADLGKCDPLLLGGSITPGMLAPYAGQVVVQTNCASGHCHTVTATGINRVGVPAGLNFDVLENDSSQPELDKITRGIKVAADHRQAMWGQVESGYMPPKGGPQLSAADKETLRNWLACGPNAIAAPGAAIGNDWGSIYKSLAGTCSGVCHGPTTAMGSGNGFLLGDLDATNPANVCAAYHNVVNKKAVTTTGMCASMNLTLVVPGQPDASLLLKKLEGTQPCGEGMPFKAPLGPNNATTQAVRQWIMNGAPPPPGCV